MIKCDLQDVSEEQELQLRALLSSGGFGTLLKVLESKVKLHQSNALNDAAKANEHENYRSLVSRSALSIADTINL